MVKHLFSYQKVNRDLFTAFCLITAGLLLIEVVINPRIEIFFPKNSPISQLTTCEKEVSFQNLLPEKKKKSALIPCDLSKEIELLTCPQRPDSKDNERLFVFLKSSQSRMEVFLEKWIYIDSTIKGFHFSNTKTPLSFKVLKKPKGLFIEMDLQPEVLEEKGFSLEKPKGFFAEVKPYLEKEVTLPFIPLFQATYWGKDLLRDEQIYQLELEEEAFFVKQDDLFVYRDNRWERAKDTDDLTGYCLFSVKTASDKKFSLDAWNEKGEYFSKDFTTQTNQKPLNKPSNWLREVRKRTKTKVSALVSGKRMLLKKGDWLVEKNGRWTVLRLDIQKENYLDHKSTSEIFVFDDILENKGDKKLVGFLYNPSRSAKKRMEFPFASSSGGKKEAKTNRNKIYTPITRRKT